MIGVLWVGVFGAVVIVLYGISGGGAAQGTPGALATVNAALNGSAALFLLTGYLFIRKRNVKAHRTCMVTAFVLSSLFLVTYLLHHAWSGYAKLPSLGYDHVVINQSDEPYPAHVVMPGVHRVASLLKRWLLGTYQGAVSNDHLDHYLDEFTVRFNRRDSG